MRKVTNKITFNSKKIQPVNDDTVMFAEPLQIVGTTDRQWNGTIYDYDTLNTDSFDGTITADHSQEISGVIGKAIGLHKDPSNKRVLMDGIRFAVKENPLARLARDLMRGGFLSGFSCETMGDDPDEQGVWHNHSLCGLSLVVHPNDKNAYAVIANSLDKSRRDGLDTSRLEKQLKNKDNDNQRLTRLDNIAADLHTNAGRRNGGGNPYHDAEGKFTTGPSTAFGKFSEGAKGKYLSQMLDGAGSAASQNTLTPKQMDAVANTMSAMRQVEDSTHQYDPEDRTATQLLAPIQTSTWMIAAQLRRAGRSIADAGYYNSKNIENKGRDEFAKKQTKEYLQDAKKFIATSNARLESMDNFIQTAKSLPEPTPAIQHMLDSYNAMLAGSNTLQYVLDNADFTSSATITEYESFVKSTPWDVNKFI